MATIFKARLVHGAGTHREGSGATAKDYKPGEIVESSINLVAAFPGKFEDPSAGGPAEEVVTAEFADAEEAGLVVVKRDRRYYVCGPGGVGNELSGALQRDVVDDFVFDYIDSLPTAKDSE